PCCAVWPSRTRCFSVPRMRRPCRKAPKSVSLASIRSVCDIFGLKNANRIQGYSAFSTVSLDDSNGTNLERWGRLSLCSGNHSRKSVMLTRKQYELLVYIDRHLKQTGFSPSFEEMKDALNLKSKSGIHRLISALEERGYLARRHHRARALDVLRLPDNMLPREAVASPEPEEVEASGGFTPNVIRGDFTQRLPGVRTA